MEKKLIEKKNIVKKIIKLKNKTNKKKKNL